jgi:hypothetical protein
VSHEVEPLLPWLKGRRRANSLELDLMIRRYDIDGALDAGQPELAWRTRELILVSGIELFLCYRGFSPVVRDDVVDRAIAVTDRLAKVSRPLAAEAVRLLLQPAPTENASLRGEMQAVDTFLREQLSIESAGARGTAIQVWADGLRVVREVGRALQVAGSGNWYLPEDPDTGDESQWYDEVINHVSERD